MKSPANLDFLVPPFTGVSPSPDEQREIDAYHDDRIRKALHELDEKGETLTSEEVEQILAKRREARSSR
jgi:hypothetical protein